MREFKFGQNYIEDVKIGEHAYPLNYSDGKLREYQMAFNKFYQEYKDIEGTDLEALPVKKQQEIMDKTEALVSKVIDTMLGAGAFKQLYAESGNSLLEMMDVVMYLSEVIGEKSEALREENRKKYTQETKFAAVIQAKKQKGKKKKKKVKLQ